jgi:hypothetical protein
MTLFQFFFHYILSTRYDTKSIENALLKISSIVTFLFFAAGKCLQSRCLATLRGDTETQTTKWFYKRRFIFENKENRLKSGILALNAIHKLWHGDTFQVQIWNLHTTINTRSWFASRGTR